MKEINAPYIVIFVEGDTDEIFFKSLVEYYKENSRTRVNSCEVVNLKGVARYSNKVAGKLKNEICPRVARKSMYVKAVCCSYDTDVFEFAEKPVVDWNKVKKVVKEIGIQLFHQIEVHSMIEDWLLDDLNGVCSFLGIAVPNNISGNNGYRKIQILFRKAQKVYFKGKSISKLMPYLDISLIRRKNNNALLTLEKLLNVKIEDMK